METKIKWTDEGSAWLQEVYNFIAEDNPDAADKLVDDIFNKAQILTKFPELGYRVEDFPQHHVRALLYGHYRIVYLIKPNREIDILGVFHGALDLKRHIDLQ